MKGIGTCSIQLKTRVTLQLTNVLFVPSIKRNLVSISALADKGYRVTFQEDKVLSWTKISNIKMQSLWDIEMEVYINIVIFKS